MLRARRKLVLEKPPKKFKSNPRNRKKAAMTRTMPTVKRRFSTRTRLPNSVGGLEKDARTPNKRKKLRAVARVASGRPNVRDAPIAPGGVRALICRMRAT